jgi:hypothetical protein
VVVRLANLGAETKKTPDGETLFGLMALGRATVVDRAGPGKDLAGGLADGADMLRNYPSGGEAFHLAAEDYLLRRGTGWLLIGGPKFDKGRKLPAGAAEHRADLDRRIQGFAGKADAFYGKVLGRR